METADTAAPTILRALGALCGETTPLGNRILIDFILAPNHHPVPLTHHREAPTITLSLSKDRAPNIILSPLPFILSLSKD